MTKTLREELKIARMREQSAMLTMLVKDDRLKELDIDIAKLIATKRRIISDAEKAPQLLETARADVARLERQLLSQTADNRQSRPSGASESMRQKSGETKREHYARLKVMMASLEKELGL